MIEIIKTPIAVISPKDTYRFKFEHSHGDADSTTYDSVDHRMTDDELIAYIIEVKKLSDHIDSVRQGSSKAWPDLYEKEFSGFSVPVDYDVIYDGVPADMNIQKITYYGQNGDAFQVTFSGLAIN